MYFIISTWKHHYDFYKCIIDKDVTGSKASLISKDTKGSGTPKKKVKKKKKPSSTTATPREDDEWADTLTAELQTIHEDVVSPSGKKGKDEVLLHPFSTEAAVLKSQPLEKLFIETDSKILFASVFHQLLHLLI